MCLLSDTDIIELTEQHGLISRDSFSEGSLHGASYDLRVGDKVLFLRPKDDQREEWIAMDMVREVTIPPYEMVIVYTKERVCVPADIQGDLRARSNVAAKGIYFSGGRVHPGYHGRLFLPLKNLQDTPYPLRYEEPVASLSFLRLEKPATRLYPAGVIDDLPDDKKPERPETRVYDFVQLTRRVDGLSKELSEFSEAMQTLVPRIDATQRITDWMMLGGTAGVGAGVAAGMVAWLLPRALEANPTAVWLAALWFGSGALLLWASQRLHRRARNR